MITPTKSYWFVGSVWNIGGEQLDRFLTERIWQSGFTDKLLDKVRSMQPGERIAIKASYVKKKNLPFDNRGHSVSTMAIKAIGTITENLGDGRTVRVEWQRVIPPREWFFYTERTTIWKVTPGKYTTDGLIAFAFEGKPQDIDRFCNAPYWQARFGTTRVTDTARV